MRRIALISCLLLLCGCGGSLQRLKSINPSANDYATSLASEYQAYAESEDEQGRHAAASHYAEKGLKALNGEAVEPDQPDTSLSPQQQEELADARAQLMKLMTDDVRRVSPQQLARSQLLFDCWQHQLSKDLNQETAPCADEFRSTLAQLQEVTDPLFYGKEVKRTVTFAPKNTKLDEPGQATVKEVAAMVAGRKHYTVVLEAYIGRRTSQRRMTETRLGVVRSALVKAGVHPRSIRIKKEGSPKAVILSRDKIAVNTKIVTITVKTHKRTKDRE